MKKILFLLALGSVVCVTTMHAETLINERVVTSSYSGYAVDERGDIIKYSNVIVGGVLERVSYNYEFGKFGKTQTQWSGTLLQGRDFGTDIAGFEMVSLSRRNVLILYTKVDATRYYASYKLDKNELIPRGEVHATLTGEVCWIHKSDIFSLTTSAGVSTLLTYNLSFKLRKNKKINAIGTVTAINPNIQKYYKDVSGGPLGTNDLTVRILKP